MSKVLSKERYYKLECLFIGEDGKERWMSNRKKYPSASRAAEVGSSSMSSLDVGDYRVIEVEKTETRVM